MADYRTRRYTTCARCGKRYPHSHPAQENPTMCRPSDFPPYGRCDARTTAKAGGTVLCHLWPGHAGQHDWGLNPKDELPTISPDHAQQLYVDYADELSADPTFLTDMADPAQVEATAAWAREVQLPWPPPACVDTALEYVRLRGLDDGTASTTTCDGYGEPML